MSTDTRPISIETFVAKKVVKGPYIRPATFDDYDGIAAVESRNGLTCKSHEQWLDLWLANPAFHQLRQWTIGWVIEDNDGRIVGSLGNIPYFFYLNGTRYVASAGRGWAVDPDYRKFSIMLLVPQIKSGESDINVVTTPGPTTAALCTRLGWLQMPVGRWDRSQFWIVNYARAAQRYLAMKGPKPLNDLASRFPRRQNTTGKSTNPKTRRGHYHLDWSEDFDERFDTFWQELHSQRDGLLLAVRDSRTLAWHFKYALARKHLWILTVTEKGALAGYALLERRDVQAFGLSRVVLIDLQLSASEPEVCFDILNAIRSRCKRESVDVIENLGCWLRELHPVPNAPHCRKLEWWSHLYRITNPALNVPRSAWYPTQYDGDASL